MQAGTDTLVVRTATETGWSTAKAQRGVDAMLALLMPATTSASGTVTLECDDSIGYRTLEAIAPHDATATSGSAHEALEDCFGGPVIHREVDNECSVKIAVGDRDRELIAA